MPGEHAQNGNEEGKLKDKGEGSGYTKFISAGYTIKYTKTIEKHIIGDIYNRKRFGAKGINKFINKDAWKTKKRKDK